MSDLAHRIELTAKDQKIAFLESKLAEAEQLLFNERMDRNLNASHDVEIIYGEQIAKLEAEAKAVRGALIKISNLKPEYGAEAREMHEIAIQALNEGCK